MDEISTSLQQEAKTGNDAIIKDSIDQKSADCMGRVLYKSDLSDEKAMAKVAPEFVNCVPAMKQLKDQLGQLTGTPQP